MGEFTVAAAEPMGQEPSLGSARPDSCAQKEQIEYPKAAE
jgi:hypothetical protein